MYSFKGEGGILEEGLTPLLNTLLDGQGEREGVLERGDAPLLLLLPLPLLREGGQGDRFLNTLEKQLL